MTKEELAKELYEEYCKAVGGVAWNGDPLPSWAEFSVDKTKTVQARAWIIIAMYLLEEND